MRIPSIIFRPCAAVLTRRKFSTKNNMELPEVIKALKSYAPLSLAEKWDNVGLLIEPSSPHVVKNILLTNDLTPAVLSEAIDEKTDLILSYHPPIFSPMKSLTQRSWKEQIAVKCIENRIALYSPHTCYDSVAGGVTDWLISAFDCTSIVPITNRQETLEYSHKLLVSGPVDCIMSIQQTLESQMWEHMNGQVLMERMDNGNSEKAQLSISCHARHKDFLTDTCQRYSVHLEAYCLDKVSKPGYGSGRVGKLSSPVTLDEAIISVKKHLNLQYLRAAGDRSAEKAIHSVAVCAGSGSSVLKNSTADLLVTGEMSHHDVLDHVCNGRYVILCEHSNTERGFLTKLAVTINNLLCDKVNVVQSKVDADPLTVV